MHQATILTNPWEIKAHDIDGGERGHSMADPVILQSLGCCLQNDWPEDIEVGHLRSASAEMFGGTCITL